MKVVVIEINYHAEVLDSICPLLLGFTEKLTVITTNDILKKTNILSLPIEIHCKSESTGMKRFLKDAESLINQHDIILFNTIHSHFRYWDKLNLQPKKIAIVHNVNAFFKQSSVDPKMNPFLLWKDFSYLLRIILGEQEFYYRSRFLKKINFFAFPSQALLEYVQKQHLLEKSKILAPPICWKHTFSSLPNRLNKHQTNITIVGYIDQRKRDYLSILETITFLQQKDIKNVKITFLGRPIGNSGRKFINQVKNQNSTKIAIECFDDFVAESKFQEVMKETSFLILPLKEKTRHHIWTEYYGKTKISGNVFDIIKYGLPAIIPSFYPLPNNLDQITASYNSQHHLQETVLHWITDKPYQKFNIEEALKAYQKPKIESQLKHLLESALK